jgi:methylenetetrahydrofolate reductase (NADPH)
MSSQMDTGSRLAAALQAGRLALLAECLPPRGADGGALKKAASLLPEFLDAVVVPDGGSEVRVSALAGALALAKEGREPVLSLATRDRNRIALYSDVLGAAALEIVNVLCLSGDHQTRGACPEAAGVFDVDSVQLLLGLRNMRDEQAAVPGEPPEAKPSLFLGAMAHPGLRPLALSIIDLRKKVEAGAQFLLTPPVFDIDAFREWMQAARDSGIHQRCHLIVSVKPLRSAEEAEEMRVSQRGISIPDELIARLAKADDPSREGVAVCGEIAGQMKSVEGVRGIQVACGGREELAAEITERASLRQK